MAGTSTDNNLDNLANDADVALAESEGRPQADAAGVPSEQDGQESPKATITGEADITTEDAKDLAEFIIEGSAGMAEEFWPVLEFDEKITKKGVDRLQPLMHKYAARMFPLAGRSISILKIYKEYGDEVKAAYFFGNVIAQCVRAVRADKAAQEKGANDDQKVEG